jgi:DNA polymerase-3 subunit delta'
MNEEAANSFLKTLEEPPPRSVLILLTTEPQRLLETILSRCLRLNFAGEGPQKAGPAQMEWLASFSEMAAVEQKSLLSRYRLLDVLLRKLTALKTSIEESLAARSPLGKHEEAEEDLRDRWERELNAAVEAEYRRQRSEFLLVLQWWLRDVWLQTLGEDRSAKSEARSPKGEAERTRSGEEESAAPGARLSLFQIISSPKDLLVVPELAGTQRVAQRLSPNSALENLRIMEQLQGLLHTNVQEALALEVGLLQLRL